MLTIFNGAGIKVGVANFCVAMDTLIDQDADSYNLDENIVPALHCITLYYDRVFGINPFMKSVSNHIVTR